jgi:hypothetical protein
MSDPKLGQGLGRHPAVPYDPEFARRPRTKAPGRRLAQVVDSPEFAVVFGIAGPILCFSLKPLLISRYITLPGLRFIDIFWLFGYSLIGLEIATMALWLRRGDRLGVASGLAAGVLLVGALFAGGLGLCLLPFSAIGLMVGIGAFGFVPFLTSIAFFQAARRAFRQAETPSRGGKAWAAVLAGMLLVIGLPGAIQSVASLTVRRAIRDVADGDASAARRIKFWHPFGDCDRLLWAYESERDPVRKGRFAAAYKDVTGFEADFRAWQDSD